MAREQFTSSGFLKSYALPALFVLLIPVVGIWFAGHAIGRVDRQIHDSVVTAINRDTTASEADKASARAFYDATPVSSICRGGTPQFDRLASGFADVCSNYTQFGWIRWISVASIAVGLLAFLFASICVAVSLTSQRALFTSFVVGWHVLKVAALLQAVGQGVVIVMLSYWMTVVWFDLYVVKLVALAGIAALGLLWLIVKAIFARIDATPSIDGVLLAEAAAPRFWAHTREMCRALGTAPPDQIIAGVDDNFFVTENAVMLKDRRLQGRTLFVSFSLLKVMEKREADAVLAHEMAHFSGDDTLYTRKMSPLLARYGEYLGALHRGGVLSRPLFHFMLFFWALFQLSINRMSRLREFRADAIAAGATSPADMGRALVKVMAYANYRARIEQALFSANVKQETLGIAGRVASGFASYATSSSLLGDLGGAAFPHPFDSHPRLDARLVAIKSPVLPSHYAGVLTTPVAASWLNDIDGADDIERTMWAAYEQRFAAAHEESLAWRYVPSSDEERALVERYFPAAQIATKKADGTLEINFAQVRFSEWEAPVGYGDIKGCAIRESFGRKFLTITLHAAGRKVEIPLHRFAGENEIVRLLERYLSRHGVMTAHQAQLRTGSGTQA